MSTIDANTCHDCEHPWKHHVVDGCVMVRLGTHEKCWCTARRPTPVATTAPWELLTIDEHELVRDLGRCWNRLCRIIGAEGTRAADLAEMCSHFHALQNAVLAQAAARAYPTVYRLLGETFVEQETKGRRDG